MAKIPFTVSARTARLIGRENVANAESALIELVKNCYDADSELAIVLIDKSNDSILIIDSGDGMEERTITEQWMTIGTDDKLYNVITEGGRVKAGAKGIGRFALDRLGERCTMITFPKSGKEGLQWVVNWADFENRLQGKNVNINEVYADVTPLNKTSYRQELKKVIKSKLVQKLFTKSHFKSGTLLYISKLRDNWYPDSIERIYNTLELLTPPEGDKKIDIYLLNEEEPKKYGLITNNKFSDYDYKLIATYKQNKNFNIRIDIHRNEFDFNQIDNGLFDFAEMQRFPFDKKTFRKEHFTINTSLKNLVKGFSDVRKSAATIGDFKFTFYFLKNQFFKEDREKFKYKDFLGDRGEWLKRFGGIKLYRDNFRVRPYGEINTTAYDWLMLGERYLQNPAAVSRKGSRVRSNQVAGVLKFSRLTNNFLQDKSSREGLQENDTFELLKNILISIIKIQEDDRSTIAYYLNELHQQLNEDEKAFEESKVIADEDENPEDFEQAKSKARTVKKGFRAAEAKLKQKDEELAISRAMASAGIMIASFSHEFHGIKNDLKSRTYDLQRFLMEVVDRTKLKSTPDRKNPLKIIEDFHKQDDKIRQWIEFSVQLTRKDRRKVKKLNSIEYLTSFNRLWHRLLEERNISLKTNYNKAHSYYVKVSELDLDTIFDNLLTNSIEAFQRNGFSGNKIISITVQATKSQIVFTYKDTGPGIPTEYKNINDIFTPFETSKKDDLGNDIGTGLGMWLVKSSIDANKGSVELIRPSKGFEIKISLNSQS